jgi:hypothetical protein
VSLSAFLTTILGTLGEAIAQSFLGWLDDICRDQALRDQGRFQAETEALEGATDAARRSADIRDAVDRGGYGDAVDRL